MNELNHHYLYLYINRDQDGELDKLKNLETESNKIKEKINKQFKVFEEYKKKIILIESYIKEAPLSLRKKAEEKLLNLKKEIKIKEILIKYYYQYSNYIIINNMCSILHTILNISMPSIKGKPKFQKYDESKNIIEQFLNCDTFIAIKKLMKPKEFFTYSLLTKNYLNKEENIKDKNESKELILDLSYLDVLNINFQMNETLIYNILAVYCQAKK